VTASRSVGHILVVDDEQQILDILKKALLREGFQVHAALDGRQALVQLATLPVPPFLVVTDLQMPGMNGLQFLDALRAASLTADLEILVLTGAPHEAPSTVRTLAKPIDLQQLVQTVNAIWAKKRRS
jgi:CheY-like chemotaxis protein